MGTNRYKNWFSVAGPRLRDQPVEEHDPRLSVQVAKRRNFRVGLSILEVEEVSLTHARAALSTMHQTCAQCEQIFFIRSRSDPSETGALLLSPWTMEKIVSAQIRKAVDETKGGDLFAFHPIAWDAGRLRLLAEWRGVRAVMNGTQWLTAKEIGVQLNSKAAKPWQLVGQWERAGRVFSIMDVERKFPRYLLDEHWRPLAGIRAVLSAFSGRTAYEIAAWFESSSSMLRGRRPRELLAEDPSAVLAAAKDQVICAMYG